MSDTGGLQHALLLDGKGGARDLDWAGVRAWTPDQGALWMHLDMNGAPARAWFEDESGVDGLIRTTLLQEAPRPRSQPVGDALLAVLRGVNLNPKSDPEDMVALRLYLDPHRALTLRNRRVMSVVSVREALAAGRGPRTVGEVLVHVADAMIHRIAEVVGELDESVDDMEESVLTAESYELRTEIGRCRRDAISLRRYLAPQRDAMGRLYTERLPWLTDTDRAHLREAADRVTRAVEDIDSARDRAAVAQEELNSRLAEQMNKNMYLLSIVAAVFLPLGLLTGLLGINVGGIPGTESPLAFAAVCVLLVLLAIGEIWWFRKRRFL